MRSNCSRSSDPREQMASQFRVFTVTFWLPSHLTCSFWAVILKNEFYNVRASCIHMSPRDGHEAFLVCVINHLNLLLYCIPSSHSPGIACLYSVIHSLTMLWAIKMSFLYIHAIQIMNAGLKLNISCCKLEDNIFSLSFRCNWCVFLAHQSVVLLCFVLWHQKNTDSHVASTFKTSCLPPNNFRKNVKSELFPHFSFFYIDTLFLKCHLGCWFFIVAVCCFFRFILSTGSLPFKDDGGRKM